MSKRRALWLHNFAALARLGQADIARGYVRRNIPALGVFC
jgi:hypothetical protein